MKLDLGYFPELGFSVTQEVSHDQRKIMKSDLGRTPALDVYVTQEVIDNATARNSSHCVVADAIRDHLEAKHPGRYMRFAVDLQTIRFTDKVKNERYTYLSPRACQVCLVKFDQGIKPEPFAFRLRSGQTTRAGLSIKERERVRIARDKSKEKHKDDDKKFVAELKKEDQKGKADPKGKMRKPEGGTGHSALEKVGGKTPPVSIGLRRSFGLRAFDI